MPAYFLLLISMFFGPQDRLTNQEVLDLVQKGLSSQLLVAMIRNTDTEFETSAASILELREKGVPDEVLEAMLDAQGPPDLSDDGELLVFITDSESWQISGGFAAGDVAGLGYSGGGARPQTAEIIKTFGQRCPDIPITNQRERADYIVILDHEGGKSIVRRDNKVAVFGRDGISFHSKSTRSLGNAVKGACAAIRRVESQFSSSQAVPDP